MAEPRPSRRTPAQRQSAEVIAERRANVFELYLIGASVRVIAARLEMPKSVVQDDIQAVIRSRTWEATEHLQKGAQARIGNVLSEHTRLYYEAARGAAGFTDDQGNKVPAREPDLDLADRMAGTLMTIEARLAKLEGTDAPTRVRIGEFTDDDLRRAIASRIEQLRAVNPDHPLIARLAQRPVIEASVAD